MGIRGQISFTITVFVWESEGKFLLQKSNSEQLINCKVKILGKSFYSPSSKVVAGPTRESDSGIVQDVYF